MKNIALFLILSTLATYAYAGQMQSHPRIRAVALAYLQEQARALPGKVTVQLGEIDQRTTLQACAHLEAFMPEGARLMGRTTVGVRCLEPGGWRIFLQANLRIRTTRLVANRPLAQNTLLTSADFSLSEGELSQPGILIDPRQALGKTLRFPLGAGQILREDMLRDPYLVTQGHPVDVRARGQSFTVRASGLAMNNAAIGQYVKVRMPSGQVIAGKVASDGMVSVE